jgi:hypothetical protein
MPILTTTISDQSGDLRTKLKQLLPSVLDRFDGLAAFVTTTTHAEVFSLLDDHGVCITTGEPDFDSIGRHRRESLRLALRQTAAEHLLVADLDHVLRWIEIDPIELDRVLQIICTHDCTVIGRGPRSFGSLPDRLAKTEVIVNHIYKLVTGNAWDMLMAARGLSRGAAEVIVQYSTIDTIGNDVEWPLLCHSRGFSLQYVEAEGLIYKTNIDYALDREDSLDCDASAWATRMLIAKQHVDAMLPYATSKIEARNTRPPSTTMQPTRGERFIPFDAK